MGTFSLSVGSAQLEFEHFVDALVDDAVAKAIVTVFECFAFEDSVEIFVPVKGLSW